MKTNIIAQNPVPCAPQGIAVASRLTGLGRFLLAVVCASLFSLVSLPSALAAGADGDYKFVSASGFLSAGGDTYELPQDLIQDIGAIKNGKITIKDNTIQFSTASATKIIKQIGDQLGLEFDTKVTGPKTLKLTKKGNVFSGANTKPLVVTFDTTYNGQDISGVLKFKFDAKVKNKTLTLHAKVTGNALGLDLTGELTIISKR